MIYGSMASVFGFLGMKSMIRNQTRTHQGECSVPKYGAELKMLPDIGAIPFSNLGP